MSENVHTEPAADMTPDPEENVFRRAYLYGRRAAPYDMDHRKQPPIAGALPPNASDEGEYGEF
jgi:hypothetical protein